MAYKKVDVDVPGDVTSLAYIAGVVDSDGSIGIHHKNGRYHVVRINVANTDRSMMDWLLENVGGSVRRHEKKNDDWANIYYWEIYAQNAGKVLSAIEPFLVVKQEQAELALELRATKEANHQSGLPASVREKRQNLKKRMNELNAKGRSS